VLLGDRTASQLGNLKTQNWCPLSQKKQKEYGDIVKGAMVGTRAGKSRVRRENYYSQTTVCPGKRGREDL